MPDYTMQNVKITPEGIIEDLKPTGKRFTLKELQTVVGGYIEVYHTKDKKKKIVVNEDGNYAKLKYNKIASDFFNQNTKFKNIKISGTVAVIDAKLLD